MNDYHKPWIRTCQECGHKQPDHPIATGKETTQTYNERKCHKCKSPSLDRGSFQGDDFPEE
jgi:hypothetical protein